MKNLTVLFAFLIITTSCFGKNKKNTYTNKTFHQIEFSEITFTLDKKTLDTLQIEGLLKQKTIIDGIPCYGTISFHKDWELKNFTLADAHTFGGYTFPKDTDVGININIISLKYFWVIRWTKNPMVNTCKFTSNQQIDGLSCESNEEVIFNTDWSLRACILGGDDTVAGNMLKKSTFVWFKEDSSIRIFCLYNPIIQGYQLKGKDYTRSHGGDGISFYPNGQLKYCRPFDDITEVQGVFCKSSSTRGGLWFYENGQLKRCTSAKDQTIEGVVHEKNFTLKFDEDGNITDSYKDKFF